MKLKRGRIKGASSFPLNSWASWAAFGNENCEPLHTLPSWLEPASTSQPLQNTPFKLFSVKCQELDKQSTTDPAQRFGALPATEQWLHDASPPKATMAHGAIPKLRAMTAGEKGKAKKAGTPSVDV